MKKTFSKIIIAVLALCLMLASVACGGSNWDGSKVTLKDGGAVISYGGFIAETDKYVYFINGKGDSSADNTLGVPVKGALYAAEKSNLDNVSIVVPKLFVASDYNAGVYIFGGYVYYGSPATEKDSSGNIAYNELTFARTKLDGTGTETFFTVSGLSTEYRIIEVGSIVYIVYYDGVDSLVCYNTSSKTSEVIAKTDVEAQTESLNAYKFVDGDGADELTVIYTVTIYTEPYYSTAAEEQGSNYQRATASYNRVYAYKPGDVKEEGGDCVGVKVLDGEGVGADCKTYAITVLSGEYIFYTETDGLSKVKTYGATASDLHNGTAATLIDNSSLVAETTLISELSNVYVIENAKIVKTTLVGNTQLVKKTIADGAKASTLLFVYGDYIYYYNSENKIARICISDDIEAREEKDLIEQVISEDTVDTAWYMPEIVNDKIFYLDNSSSGASYIKYVAIDSTATSDIEKDDDGKITSVKLTGHKTLGFMLEEDKASIVSAKINALSTEFASAIAFDKDDDDKVILVEGVPTISSIADAREAYEALSATAKDYVTEDTLAVLKKYEKAFEIAKLLYKLNGFDELDDTAKTALQDAYNAAKAALESLKNSTDFDYSAIRSMMPENLNFFYQEATEFFTAE